MSLETKEVLIFFAVVLLISLVIGYLLRGTEGVAEESSSQELTDEENVFCMTQSFTSIHPIFPWFHW